MSNSFKFILLFIFLYVFRTLFGLTQTFFSPDEIQTYLIGLKFYCTHAWPFFGPDLIVTETGFYSQIPGPLEGLLIGGPLWILPIPEAPFLILNLLSLGALALFAQAIHRRVPAIPYLFIFVWISLLPWNLHESANPINPSYLLLGSILFFTGFLETVPTLSTGWFSPRWGFALMGFGLFWDMQFHFSWILLLPFVAFAFLIRFRDGRKEWKLSASGFLLGLLPIALLILPTFLKYGWTQGQGGLGTARLFNPDNVLAFGTVLGRFFSLACFEIPRFVGGHTAQRLAFFQESPWLIPPGLFLLAAHGIQFLIFIFAGWKFWKDGSKAPLILAAGTFFLVYVSFWFTYKEPLAHIYYVLIPVVIAFSFMAYRELAGKTLWRTLGILAVLSSLWFWGGYIEKNLNSPKTLFSDRALVQRAITEKNYHLLGERRPGSLY